MRGSRSETLYKLLLLHDHTKTILSYILLDNRYSKHYLDLLIRAKDYNERERYFHNKKHSLTMFLKITGSRDQNEVKLTRDSKIRKWQIMWSFFTHIHQLIGKKIVYLNFVVDLTVVILQEHNDYLFKSVSRVTLIEVNVQLPGCVITSRNCLLGVGDSAWNW